ncbi:chorismate synthase [Catenibacillus scindens]|uniref:chorismate synthase n=1 Tax=Catenibacillus scindens TaxID=673271 RepID=UPI003207A411
MPGSTYGNRFKITTWGESHGKAVGVVIDGCPAGLPLCEEDIQKFLDRRKPGQNKYATPRREDDQAEILSGIFQGQTTGTPISLLVWNKTARSQDYSKIASYYRPGHADYTFDEKYSFRDYRGGGRTSGRETIGRVAAGAIASKLLEQLGIRLCAYTKSIGNVSVDEKHMDFDEISKNPLYMPDHDAAVRAQVLLDGAMARKDSVGGIIECQITGLFPGIGEPVFDKLDACLARAMLSIGAVKGFEIGEGFRAAGMFGSENNDGFIVKNGEIAKRTNHSGGVLGGLSDGAPVIFRVAVKPTPSIAASQTTVNKNMEEIPIEITGRHDPVIVPRAVVVVEAMAALTVADLLLENMSARLDRILDFYSRNL